MRLTNIGLARAVAVLIATQTARAQEVLWEINAIFPEFNDFTAIDSIQDLDGQGSPDLVVGASDEMRVLSFETGETILCVNGVIGDLGHTVATLGDFDGDGVDDFAAGAPSANYNAMFSGLVQVFSGATGELIADISGLAQESQNLGSTMDAAGDVNADGYADVIIGCLFCERVQINLGPDGRLLRTHAGQFEKPSVAGVGDMNADGYDDYAIGWPAESPATCGEGRAVVHSGLDGTVIHEVFGPTPSCFGDGSNLGRSVAGAGDVNGDGVPDFIAGAPQTYRGVGGTRRPGFARVYSGTDASIIHEVTGELGELDAFGRYVSGGGDINRDGYDDFVVGAPREGPRSKGSISAFCGRSGQMLWKRFAPDPAGSVNWGFFAAVLDDFDGDGHAEFAATDRDLFDGAVVIYKGSPGGVEPACAGAANSTGQPARLDFLGPLSVGNDLLRLGVHDVPPGTFLIFAYAASTATVPFGNGTLCLGGTIYRVNDPVAADAEGFGEASLPFTIPPAGSGPGQIQPGETWHVQCWYRDPLGGGAFFNLSDAQSVLFPL